MPHFQKVTLTRYIECSRCGYTVQFPVKVWEALCDRLGLPHSTPQVDLIAESKLHNWVGKEVYANGGLQYFSGDKLEHFRHGMRPLKNS